DKSKPERYPLGGICFLHRAAENEIHPLTPAQALPLLWSQTPHVLGRADMERLLSLADQLLEETPLWQLFCNAEEGAAQVARTALTGERP
ncbi:MAG: hypothetical protein RR035_07335, partial [Oscillibacter sp.]